MLWFRSEASIRASIEREQLLADARRVLTKIELLLDGVLRQPPTSKEGVGSMVGQALGGLLQAGRQAASSAATNGEA